MYSKNKIINNKKKDRAIKNINERLFMVNN